MHIIVVGAGLAGLTVAIALRKAGHQVTVVEAVPQIAYIGAGIQVSPNASRILRHLGIEKYVESYCTEPVDLRMMRWENGQKLVECPLKKPAREQYDSPYWHIHRADFHRGLSQCANERGIQTLLDSRVVEFDGIRWVAFDMPRGCPWLPQSSTTDRPDGINQAVGTGEDVRKAFQGWDARLHTMLSHVDKVLQWRLYTHHEIPSWTHPSQKMCLIGDAAHAMTPYLAQGAAMGIEDAAVLGGILAESDFCSPSELPKALALYEKLRIKRAARIAEASVSSRWFTHMDDGPEQIKRDEWLLVHPGIWPGHINIRSRKEFLDELFGYDAYAVLDAELRDARQAKERRSTAGDGEADTRAQNA
ncbi:putative FAD-binding domain-containing protein [Seiridium cardinale]